MNTFTLIDNIINSGIKLKLDSGKLKIIAPQDKLTPGLMEEIKSRKNEIIQLLSGINKSTAIIPVEKKEYYPASSAQKRLYIVQQMDMESTAYNIPQVMPFEIGIEQDKVEDIFIKLIARHESLHTSFIVVNEEIVQEIKEKVVFKIVRFQNQNEPLTASEANEIMLNFTRPFDLSEAPLLRVGVIKTNDGKCGFLLDMHHIVTDGTSQSILVKEFMALYNEAELPPLRLQYKDYSDWQNSKKQREVIKEQERYWLEIFSHEAPVINLPTDYPRPKTQGFEGSRVDFLLTVKESQALKEIAAQTGATLYMCILSVFTILLARLSGQEDIVVGTPIAARKHVDLEKVIGFFVNTLAMRISPCGEKSYKEFLLELKDHTLEAYENQEYPFEELVDKISGSRDTGRNPIFDVMFNLMNIEEYNQDTPGSEEREQYKNRHQKATSKFDLTLTAVDIGERFLLNIEYCTRLFKPGTIDRFISYFKNLFNSLSGGYNMKLSEFDIIAEEERHRILCEFNDTYAEYPKDKTIHRLFEEQVEQTSDHVAVVAPCIDTIHESHQQITYKELNEKSNRLAHGLQTKGVGPDTIVGIIMKRSVEMITGILGILKSGGAYLPIDEANPTERKKYMLEDSGVKLVLANKELLNRSGYLPGYIEIIDTGCEEYYSNDRTNFDYTPRGSDLVYMLYTSGSTGRPKGVMLEHSNLVNLFRFQFEYTNLKCSKILQFSALGFDAHFHEIFSALLSGGRIYLVAQEIRTDIPELFKLIERYGISTVFWPISFIKIIFSEEEYAKRVPLCLEHIQTAGEQVIISDNFRKYLKKNKVYLHNHYGPAETHVVTTLTINPGEDIPELPSIGKPILNTYIYIMDKKNHLSPIGVAGELWIGGVQVGRGYCGREELTGEKFIRNPFRLDEKVYKSGDLARWLTNGNIEFLGRIDHQVKIRGYRVEIGEIESRLSCCPGIKEMAVLALQEDNGDKYICAYIVADKELSISGLRDNLSKELPDFMIPAYFVRVEKIPLTPNGKVDRKALPIPKTATGESYIAPRDEVEKKLTEIWSEVLVIDKEKIGIDTNFFELGGHSLKATILVSKIHKEFEVKVPLSEVFKSPRIESLGGYIKGRRKDIYMSIKPVEKKEYYPLSSAQKRLYILQQMQLDSTTYNMPEFIPLKMSSDFTKIEDTFKKLIARHENFHTSFYMLNDEPVQVIHDDIGFEIESNVFDSTFLQEGRTPEAIIKSFIRPFDLSKAPLLRVGIVQPAGGGHAFLMVDMHHIISDGASHGVLLKDFLALYEGEELLPLRIQYKDFSQWQNSEKKKASSKQQEIYWMEIFKDSVPDLNLPIDYPRPTEPSDEGSIFVFEISSEQVNALYNMSVEEGATLFMTLLAIYYILLFKITGQENIVVGVPVEGRKHSDLQNIIGMFVNMLAIRNYPRSENSFESFFKEVKNAVLKALENQDYQFEDLVDKLVVKRTLGRNPLIDTVLRYEKNEVIQDETSTKNENKEEKILFDSVTRSAKFDLILNIIDSGNRLFTYFNYKKKLFKPETIERISNYFKTLISEVIKNPRKKISEIEILSEDERKRIIQKEKSKYVNKDRIIAPDIAAEKIKAEFNF